MPETHDKSSTPADIYAARRDKLRGLMRQRDLDALLVCQAPNRFYLSGFELHDPQPNESAGYLLVTSDGQDWLFTDARYAIAAGKVWDAKRIFIHAGDAAKALAGLIMRHSSKAGIETEGISEAFGCRLRQRLKNGGTALFAANGLVEKLRVIKDVTEIEALSRSFALNHQLLAFLETEIQAGKVGKLSEKELAWTIERFFRENGAQELAFASITASGVNAAMPHALPGDGPIGENLPLLVDIGCRVDNYCSDQTRTWWLGPTPSREYTETLKLVRQAQEAAMYMMGPGISCRDAWAAARAVFEKAGVEKYFNHGLGHGVGLETHEAPSLSSRGDQKLEAGMVVTVEPGLYYPAWGGVRWENTVLITDTGVKIL